MDVPQLGAVFDSQLSVIEPSVRGGCYVYPGAAILKDGTFLNCVYFATMSTYRRLFGLDHPSASPVSKWLSPQDIASIHQSSARLPAKFAREIYQAGESGMGYYMFTVKFSWWSSRAYVTSHVDFIDYPPDKGPRNVRSVFPHVGNRKVAPPESQLKIYWCVFADRPSSMAMEIPAGTGVYVGAPARPFDTSLIKSFRDLVASCPDVKEAHIPQVWVQHFMPEAAQILVVVVEDIERSESIKRQIIEGLGKLLTGGAHLDLWVLLPDNSLLPSIRAAGCRLFPPQ